MVLTNDLEVNMYLEQKRLLVIKYSTKEITEKEFDRRREELDSIIREKNYLLIEEITRKRREEEKYEVKQKPQIEVVKRGPKKNVLRGFREGSLTSLIVKVLEMKTIKNIEQAIDKVMEKRSGLDEEKLRTQITLIINRIRQGKQDNYLGATYLWDDEKFLVTVR
jgi:hypothetical protein